MEGSWVKLYNILLYKDMWFKTTAEQKVIFLNILLLANHKQKSWVYNGERYSANKGEFITSLDSLVKLGGKDITKQKVRTALKKFEKMGFLEDKSCNRHRRISIVNWDKYQDYCKLEDMDIGFKYQHGTWIKLHRSMLKEDGWIRASAKEKIIKITLLLMVDENTTLEIWKRKIYRFKLGDIKTKLEDIRELSGKDISVQNVRTALKNFEKSKFIKTISCNEGRIINIINFKDYIGNKDGEEEEKVEKDTKKNIKKINKKELKRREKLLEDEQRMKRYEEEFKSFQYYLGRYDTLKYYSKLYGICEFDNGDILMEVRLAETYGEDELIEAMRISCMNGVRSFRYVEGILKNWEVDKKLKENIKKDREEKPGRKEHPLFLFV